MLCVLIIGSLHEKTITSKLSHNNSAHHYSGVVVNEYDDGSLKSFSVEKAPYLVGECVRPLTRPCVPGIVQLHPQFSHSAIFKNFYQIEFATLELPGFLE